MKKVCIIGAGTAGLCAARQAIEHKIEPTVFEQTERIGGTWVYTDETEKDKYGLDIHTSMYQGLRTNLPKEVMGYPDFPIKYSTDVSYVPSQTVLNFLEEYCEHFQLGKYIKFVHYVIRVLPKNKLWEVIVKNLESGEIITEFYDFVLVCNGHYNTPLYPEIPGMKIFEGKSLHSHAYRHADIFKNETVLIIGAGPSGMDLCHEISKYAKYVTLSHHMREKPKTKFGDNVFQKPDVKSFDKQGALFVDDSYEKYSMIFYCTGYKYAFPFLSVDCGIHVENNHVKPLYKHCLNIDHPTMGFIGIPYYVCQAQMMDLQSRFAFKYWTGGKEVPIKKEMITITEEYLKKRAEQGFYGRRAHMMGPAMTDYFEDLAKTAEIERIKPVFVKLHNLSSERFVDDLLHFRDDVFRIVDDETFQRIK